MTTHYNYIIDCADASDIIASHQCPEPSDSGPITVSDCTSHSSYRLTDGRRTDRQTDRQTDRGIFKKGTCKSVILCLTTTCSTYL